jgi:hypothetical protein
MHGTNRAYIFKGVAVHEVRPDLILEVRDGTKSVEAAYAEAFPAPAGPEVRDVLGRLVPPALTDAFRDRERFLRAQRLARELLSEVDALVAAMGGAYFLSGAADCRTAIEQVLSSLRRHAPHSGTCPRCMSTQRTACSLCGGLGWVDHLGWYQASPAERATVTREGVPPGQTGKGRPCNGGVSS